jgi:hypothetical protein
MVRELIVYENGRYVMKNQLSERSVNRVVKNLTPKDQQTFLTYHLAGGM